MCLFSKSQIELRGSISILNQMMSLIKHAADKFSNDLNEKRLKIKKENKLILLSNFVSNS